MDGLFRFCLLPSKETKQIVSVDFGTKILSWNGPFGKRESLTSNLQYVLPALHSQFHGINVVQFISFCYYSKLCQQVRVFHLHIGVSSRSRLPQHGHGGNYAGRLAIFIKGDAKGICCDGEGHSQYVTGFYMPMGPHSNIYSPRDWGMPSGMGGNPLRISQIFAVACWLMLVAGTQVSCITSWVVQARQYQNMPLPMSKLLYSLILYKKKKKKKRQTKLM